MILLLTFVLAPLLVAGENSTHVDTEIALQWISSTAVDSSSPLVLALLEQAFVVDQQIVHEMLEVTRSLMRELYSLKVAHRGLSLFPGRTDKYLAIVQTGEKIGDDVLNARDLIRHSKVIDQLKYINVNLFGEKWTLHDICLQFPSPKVKGSFGDLVSGTIEDLVGCIIATPLDCFWEGSKVVGPNPPVQISEDVHNFIPSIPLGPLTWSNFNPAVVFEDVNKIVPVPKVRGLMKVAGVGKGYMDRLCIDPLDPDCPETSPNFFDMCHLVDYYLKKVDPNTTLSAKYMSKEEKKLVVLNDEEEDRNVLATDFKASERHGDLKVNSVNNARSNRRVVRQAKSEEEDYLEYENYDTGSDGDVSKLKAEAQKVCDERSTKVRLLLRKSPHIFHEYFRAFSWPQYPKYGQVMQNGCSGFSKNLLKWRAARIMGNIVHKSNGTGIAAEALQTFIKFPTAQQIYDRFKKQIDEKTRKKTLDQNTWSIAKARLVINTWANQAVNTISTMPKFTGLKMVPSNVSQ